MSLYLLQASYTSEGWKSLVRSGEDRSQAFGALAESAGGHLVGLYFAMGEWDIVALVEAADDLAISSIAIGAIQPGHLKATRTTRLFNTGDMQTILASTSRLSYQAPGGA